MMPDRPLRIGIDARYLSHNLVGGVRNYLASLVPALIAAAAGDELVLYADDKAPFELPVPPGVVLRVLPWRHAGSTAWIDLTLARRMRADGIQAAFFPANHGFGPPGAATVLTVHDALNLLPLGHTLSMGGHALSHRTRAMTVYLHLMTTWAVRRATRLVTISGYARDSIAAACHRPADDISVVYHGAPPRLAISDADVAAAVQAAGIPGRYVLADGLKNPAVVLRAAARLSPELRQAVTLLFFARHPDVLPVLADAVAAGDARLLIRPASSTLAALFSGASAFVFPSWIEGFGIPLLEAMQYGAPIIASDRGSIPEVAGEAAIIVDAEDDAGLANALVRVLTDEAEAARLRALGRERVADFTWRRCAEQTLAAIHRADAESRGVHQR